MTAPTLAPVEWPEIIPIPSELYPVEAFHSDLLPEPLRSWAIDAAHRMDDMPLDFFAVGVTVALGSMIGARLAIHPKRNDNWTVVPNVWGAGIGRPAFKKTPAFQESMRFSRGIEAGAYEDHQITVDQHKVDKEVDKLFRDKEIAKLKKGSNLSKEQMSYAIKALAEEEGDEPKRRRYIVNDATIEKLGELLRDNPMGLLLFRDELSGWMSALEREDRQQDRAFYLEGWSGTGDFSFDRIGRGEVYIPRLVVGVLGGIQPSKLARYLHSLTTGAGDDGLLQRFQLMVWPDNTKLRHIDKAPDLDALAEVRKIFDFAANLPPPDDGNHFALHFDDEAQEAFDAWYQMMLERELKEPNVHMESHLCKYHSLLPSLALIFHVVENPSGATVGIDAVDRAMAWVRYLETHARRVYAMTEDPYYNAKQLLDKLDKLPNPFRKGDFNRRGWAGLATATEINTALDDLIAHHFIFRDVVKTSTKPVTWYHLHPGLHDE